MHIALAVVLVVSVLAVWSLNLVGLPGNWLIVLAALIYASFVPSEATVDVGWAALVGLLVLAALGELIEFLASAMGATQAGASRRGTALAMVGSLVGAFAGVFFGGIIPIPIVGPLIGALLFASLGALVGAVLGEQWKGRDLDASLRVGHAAFWGRLVGTVGKIVLGVYMIGLVVIAVVF